MSSDAIASINTPGHVLTTPIMPHLMGNTLDPVALSNDLEKQIRALIIQHRKVRIEIGKMSVEKYFSRIWVIRHNLMIIYRIY
jgi:hypothetical protein